VIEKNLTTVLILEDNVGWDAEMRKQLHVSGCASWQLPDLTSKAELAPLAASLAKPYGTNWDVLWLGHCSPHQNHSSPDRSSCSSCRSNCTLAYGVTQRGARKIMYEHGIRNFDKGYEEALSEWCDGMTKNMGERPICLLSRPGIFGRREQERRA
jgi:hypothetical protein